MKVTVITKDDVTRKYENVISFYYRPTTNAMSITMEDGSVQYYKTKEISSVDVEKGE